MPDQELYVAEIRSNTDKLSARVVHDSLVSLVKREAEFGEAAMKGFVPIGKVDGGTMKEKVGHHGPVDSGMEIRASVGIPEIHKPNESDFFSGKYSIFADQGTGIFSDRGEDIYGKKGNKMYIPMERGYPGYILKSKGQEGQEFSAKSFAAMVSALRMNGEAFRIELSNKLKADKSI